MSDYGKTVLIIDDDITIRKLLSHNLKAHDFKTFEADSADEGFNYLENNNIDLVLCDVTLGKMDGFTFCKKVRENESYKLIPFIFVTAKNSYEDKTRALEVGGDDIITKPFDVNELILKVKTVQKRSDIYKLYGVKKNLNNTFQKKSFKILLVDDDTSLSQAFRYNLQKAGFECKSAESGKEGLEILMSFKPDIIISDIMMPNMNGFEFRNYILERTELKSIPFIFLTAKSEEQDILDGYEQDIADYVIKTEGPKVIVAKVKAIINSLSKERQKVVSELHEAADSLRIKVVPDNLPEFGGFKIKQWHLPFEGIPGGDFIDYFNIDDEHLAIVLGDVMGKKWGAWYFAFAYAGFVRSALRSVLQSSQRYSPSAILSEVNKSVYKDAKVSEVFSTISILILDNKNLTASYTGAGDLPLVYKNSSDNTVKRIQSKGMLLGFSEDGAYEDTLINLNKSDSLLLTTDGIIETRNASDEQFGSKRLLERIQSLTNGQDELEVIKEGITEFSGGNFGDDISLISITVN
ncbi:MAG: response regulator [Bacteroidetes bacterium]|nr:response regulator [Bacteroidota bacterium]